jgi:hypothetical protein
MKSDEDNVVVVVIIIVVMTKESNCESRSDHRYKNTDPVGEGGIRIVGCKRDVRLCERE